MEAKHSSAPYLHQHLQHSVPKEPFKISLYPFEHESFCILCEDQFLIMGSTPTEKQFSYFEIT